MNCFGLFGLTWLIQLLSVVQGMEGLGDLAKIFSMLSGGDDCRLRCPGGKLCISSIEENNIEAVATFFYSFLFE